MTESSIKYVWFYEHKDGSWRPFNLVDQVNLESATTGIQSLRVQGGRFKVDLEKRIMSSVYMEPHEEYFVRRSAWLQDGTPLPEEDCTQLCSWYDHGDVNSPLTLDSRKFYRSSDGSIMLAGPTLVSPSVRIVSIGSPYSGVEVPPASGDDPEAHIDHLVICVHGIGEAMWSRKVFNREPFEVACDTFRTLISEFRKDVGSSLGRVEVLHVKWFQILSESEYARHMNDITLSTVPVLRQFANGAVSDVIFYLNEKHRRDILDHVTRRIENIFKQFVQDNGERFSGKVSLVGHSLGSVICYDLLFHNRLPFKIEKLFLLGSPLGMFLTSRGDVRDFVPLASCPQILNIFHPNDPVAYRLEPLINPLMKDTDAELVPYHLTGGLAAHTKLKQAASSLMNIFSGTDNLRGTSTYMDKISQLVQGPASPKPESPLGIATREVESLNDGRRIDWSLQKESLVTNEYAEALSAHVAYLRDRSVARFINENLR